MNENLGTYLNDHLAGANMAVDLIKTLEQNQQEESIKAFFRGLLSEVIADRDTLQTLAEQFGSGSSMIKNSAALLAAKALDVKLGAGKDPFGLFESLEFLALGILGKLHLWKALQVVATTHATKGHADYAHLIKRAETQYAEVERHRLSAAADALHAWMVG